MDISGDIQYKSFYFPSHNLCIVTSEKIGTSFLESFIEQSKEGIFLVLEFNNHKKEFYFNIPKHNDEVNKKYTEKQKLFLLDELNSKKEEIKFVFLTRDPYQKFRSGLYQILPENKEFLRFFDYFNLNPIHSSENLLENVINNGLDSLSNKNYNKFKSLFIETISYNLKNIITDMHLRPHNLNLNSSIPYISKKIKPTVLDLKKLNQFMIKKLEIDPNDIELIDKNEKYKLGLDSERNLYNLMYDVYNNTFSNNKQIFEAFFIYFHFYVKTETEFYNKLLEEYGETE